MSNIPTDLNVCHWTFNPAWIFWRQTFSPEWTNEWMFDVDYSAPPLLPRWHCYFYSLWWQYPLCRSKNIISNSQTGLNVWHWTFNQGWMINQSNIQPGMNLQHRTLGLVWMFNQGSVWNIQTGWMYNRKLRPVWMFNIKLSVWAECVNEHSAQTESSTSNI